MAKRIKKSTAIVCGVLGALVVGGAMERLDMYPKDLIKISLMECLKKNMIIHVLI